MADKVVKSLNNGDNAYKFQSEFNSKILLLSSTTTTTYPNAYVVIDGIPTSVSSATKTITLLLSLRYKRYLLKINPLHSVTTNTNQCLEVIDLGTNGSLKLADVAYAFTSKTSNGTMSIYLKLYLNATYAHCDIEDISGNDDVAFTSALIGNDNATYKETTIGAYFNELIAGQHNGAQGVIKTMQAQELATTLAIVGNTETTIESALSDLTGIANDVCSDAFSVSKLYQIGDFTIYNNDLYECITQHYGSWNASHFKKTTVATELQGRLKPFRTGTVYRIISQQDPSASNAGNGYYEINLQFTANLSASSWTDVTVTMTNGVFNWFTPEMDEYLDITVGNLSAFAGWDNKPILAHVKSAMNQANKFNVAVKALDSVDEGSNVTCFIHFTAFIYQTD